MPEINTAHVRDIVRFFDADGIQDSDPAALKPGTPDGYLSTAELRATIARVQGEFSRWREANQFKVTPIIIYEQHEIMLRRVSALESAIPAARAAEERGEPGFAYMADSFYALVKKAALSPEAINLALEADGDFDGEVTLKEVDRFIWFAETTLKNVDRYYPRAAREELTKALRPPESKVTGVSLR